MKLETLITPKARDLGDGFMVRRALPAIEKRAVGPFVFFDQMGPVQIAPGKGLDVRPHPHIGLATVTYLYEGEIMHRDSLGTVQPIRPGEVNWMVAGRGIVHSERTPPALRAAGPRAYGLQIWVALPEEDEECEPTFSHHGADEMPVMKGKDFEQRLIVGELLGKRAPVKTFSPMFFSDVVIAAGGCYELPAEHEERAAYVAEGAIEFDGKEYGVGQMLVFGRDGAIPLAARGKARVLVFGGAPLGPRRMWWNFVHSNQKRIAEAAAEWKAGRFAPVPGETEFIPLPEGAPQAVDYP